MGWGRRAELGYHRGGNPGSGVRGCLELESCGKQRTAPQPHPSGPTPPSVFLAERFLEDIFPEKEGGGVWAWIPGWASVCLLWGWLGSAGS